MAAKVLLALVTASGPGAWVKSRSVKESTEEGICQAIITATATVALEGSFDQVSAFEIATFSVSGGLAVTLPEWIRGNVTSYGSGDVSLTVDV